MKYFLNHQNRKLLEAMSYTKTLYAFDFDGTLAGIVTEPSAARLTQRTEKLLEKLASLAPVAVISGRSRNDLRHRIPRNIRYVVGNHGLEGIKVPQTKIQKAKAIVARWKKKIESELSHPVFAGVEIEDKSVSLSLHYRKCRKKKEAKARLLQILRELKEAPRLVQGKSVLNLIPEGAPHKGMALLKLMAAAGVSRTLYVGDDDTDEDVFSLPDERIFGVRVGQKKNSLAKYHLKRQSEITVVLNLLLQYHETKKS